MGTRRSLLAAAVLLPAAALISAAAPASAKPASATAQAAVTVNATASLGAVPAHAIGLNTAVYDGDMNDAAIPALLKAAGIDAIRYPGGSYSHIYNWQTQTAVGGGFVAPGTGFSSFMSTVNSAGAAPVVTVNYGTGSASLAAAWVTNAAGDNVQYWEVGNEVYGNGTYGANWEADSHCKTALNGSPVTIGSEPSQTFNCGPTEYASNFLQIQSAMHAASANAKVCAVLTTPGFWPDNVTNSEYPQSWNQTVLSALKASTQCVIVHYYPGGSTATGMLTDPGDISGIVSTLHSEISNFAGISNPSSVPIIVTETNTTIDMDTQPAALFAADMYMTWMENGVANVDWWDEHNGAGTPSTVNGVQDYGDQGMFSNGSNGSGVTEPAADTPFASYYGVEMLSKLVSPGGAMVTSSSSQPLIRTH
ncbi:MAG TPA: alpha-L-arabinofuranosidase, partial [Streptosporangiaceae bacterium]|nr:alpha-L-arabinofuranosidase [Streptosporangiaceae bacterium]